MPFYKLNSPRLDGMFLICLTLTIFCVLANAEFYKASYVDDYPWIRANREIPRESASSDHSSSYSRFLESRKKHRSLDSAESVDKPREWYSTSATKKVPTENKNFKKVISPFYTITNKDSQKYKDMVMKSGVPYCQEIRKKRVNKNSDAKNSMVCYKCKNPKSGATYEQCSYHSQPLTDSSNVEKIAVPPSVFRSRRSNSEEAFSGFKNSDNYGRHNNPYRFNEKIFSDATDDVPAEYKNKDEKCEKVVKDSMVCMVCKDTKSNAKYEQCSYVRQPSEKRYAYSKSSSHKNPETFKNTEAEKDDKEDGRRYDKKDGKRYDKEYSASKPVKERFGYVDKEEQEGKSLEETKESSDNCKKVQKDTKTCTICKDPKTGENYERCSYTYEPDDKVYKYSKSRSFGYPDSSSGNNDKRDASDKEDKSSEESRSESEDYSKDYTIPESYYEKSQSAPSSSYFKGDESKSNYGQDGSQETKSASDEDESLSGYERSKSESERVAESIEPSHCKEVQKDSMTCKICKDPKTGSNSEQCSYKYLPSDKSYSYSKSKSFGTPTESKDKSYDGSEKKESKELYESPGYDYSSKKMPYVTDSDIKDEFSVSDQTKQSEAKEESAKSALKKSDVGFYDAFKKKAEIQKVLQEFQKEDRSNCKKLMRDKMTCYQCVDEKGFQKEECAFVTSEEPSVDKSDYREEKEYHVEPTKKVPRSIIVQHPLHDFPIEPEAAASEGAYVKREQADKEKDSGEVERSKEVEPYEFAAETKPLFDKVLGFTLPAYMLSTSEHEEEFDKIVASKGI